MSTTHISVSLAIERHLTTFWPNERREDFVWGAGPISRNVPGMVVTRIEPIVPSKPWRYVSRGAWQVETPDARIEFVLTTSDANPIHVETITMVANLHADPRYRVHPGKIINIGRPWIEGASCDHLLVSLPYLLGPDFENLRIDDVCIRFLWLLPITSSEASYARTHGVDALERVFEDSRFDTLDPVRKSVV